MVGILLDIFSFFQKRYDQKEFAATSAETTPSFAHVAIYDALNSAPRVNMFSSNSRTDLIQLLINDTFAISAAKGGQVPYIAIREIIENLIHASFIDVVVTILSDGNTIRVADRGPGIINKEKAFLPGFSTASSELKNSIRGVGSGLTIAREAMDNLGGTILLEDNLDKGTVVTLQIFSQNHLNKVFENANITEKDFASTIGEGENYGCSTSENTIHFMTAKMDNQNFNRVISDLSSRQKKILLLLAEMNAAGPSNIAKELGLSLSTAYRELVYLEEACLVTCLQNKKRILTENGLAHIESIFE